MINFFGNVLGDSGYEVHARELLLATSRLTSVACETFLPVGWEHSPNASPELISVLKKVPEERGVLVAIAQPPYWPRLLSRGHEKFFGFLVFEGDKIPASWALNCNDERVSKVLVPSRHVWNAALKGGVKEEKLFLLPHGVDTKLFNTQRGIPEELKSLKSTDFTFLFSKGWVNGMNDRSGLAQLIIAFNEEFKDEPVRLLAHVNTVYCPPGWSVDRELVMCGISSNPKVVLFMDRIPRQFMHGLYKLCDVFVMPSKSEGFGLPALEALHCGRPVITTSYGGQTDFVTGENGWIVGGGVIPAFGGFSYEGVKWLEPSVSELRSALRTAFKSKGKKCGGSFKELTWENSAKKLVALVQDLE